MFIHFFSTRNLFYYLFVLLFFAFSIGSFAQNKYCLEEVKELKLDSLPGKITTYYSEGQKMRANEMKLLFERASIIFEDSLGVKVKLSLAALAPAPWAQLLDKTYGLPTLKTGACKRGGNFTKPQYVAIMPGSVDGAVYDSWIALKDSLSAPTLQKLKETGIGFEEGGKVLINFVGLHELGHAYAHAFGINYYVNFFAEFIADYLAYAFLRSTEERLDKKVMAVLSANIDGITPVHTSFIKWEGFRSSEHPPTEAWYNSILTLKAAEIYDQRGFEFLYAVKKAFPEEEGKLKTRAIIARLDSIHPGILQWSEGISKFIPNRISQIPYDSTLIRVKSLHTPVLQNGISVYYSAGYKMRAQSLQVLIQDAMHFYKNKMNVNVDLSVAVLTKPQWEQVTNVPFDIPFASDSPHVAFLPANFGEGVVTSAAGKTKHLANKETLQKLKSAGYTFEQAEIKNIDFIGLHELGHLIAEKLEISFYPGKPNKWYNEFLASYIAYAYLREKQPKFAIMIDVLYEHIRQTTPKQQYTSLEDFERLYSDVGPENYGWFQSKFMELAVKIYNAKGFTLIEELWESSFAKNEKAQVDNLLKDLEAIAPGFLSWAKNL